MTNTVSTATDDVEKLALDVLEHFGDANGDAGPEVAATLRALVQERDRLLSERAAILLEAKSWACEAKTQRSTVQEVGSALGGIPDWGPIATTIRAKLDELTAANEKLASAVDMIENCAGRPSNPDALVNMLLAHLKATTAKENQS